jgi:hypothetical protein
VAETFSGTVSITRSGGPPTTVQIEGDNGTLILGGSTQDGDLRILDNTGNTRFNFSGDQAEFVVKAPDGNNVVRIDGLRGNLSLGGPSRDGDLAILDSAGRTRFNFSGDQPEFVVKAPNGNNVVRIDGAGNITLEGEIILRNADAAEDFELADAEDVPLGSVMVLTDDGRMRTATHPYDTRVAGVLSGAGDCHPGLILGRRPCVGARRLPIALVGKAFCQADATEAPIRVGDLLTTSAMRGHAMRATDARRAFGATIGKALGPLDGGTGLVPILVALQ